MIPILSLWAFDRTGLSHYLALQCSAASDGIRFLAIGLSDLLPMRLVKSKVISIFFRTSTLKIRDDVAFL